MTEPTPDVRCQSCGHADPHTAPSELAGVADRCSHPGCECVWFSTGAASSREAGAAARAESTAPLTPTPDVRARAEAYIADRACSHERPSWYCRECMIEQVATLTQERDIALRRYEEDYMRELQRADVAEQAHATLTEALREMLEPVPDGESWAACLVRREAKARALLVSSPAAEERT